MEKEEMLKQLFKELKKKKMPFKKWVNDLKVNGSFYKLSKEMQEIINNILKK